MTAQIVTKKDFDARCSHTIAMGEVAGAQFLFCDGSVHHVSEAVELMTYRRLPTIAEGVTAGERR